MLKQIIINKISDRILLIQAQLNFFISYDYVFFSVSKNVDVVNGCKVEVLTNKEDSWTQNESFKMKKNSVLWQNRALNNRALTGTYRLVVRSVRSYGFARRSCAGNPDAPQLFICCIFHIDHYFILIKEHRHQATAISYPKHSDGQSRSKLEPRRFYGGALPH